MGLKSLIGGSIWDEYSQKVHNLVNNPKHTGAITQDEADAMGAKLVEAQTQNIHLYFTIGDGVIQSAKFQSADSPLAIACASALMELVVNKSVDEAVAINPSDIEKSLRDKHDTPALPLGNQAILETLNAVIKQAIASYKGVDVALLMPATTQEKVPSDNQETKDDKMAFIEMSIVQKVKAVDKVIDEHIRQMLIADGGNMEILDIKVNGPHIDIYIRYLGACSGCASANTGTLFAIEGTLKKELDENIRVLPI
ncbi:MAG: NifU family protein [Campylobacterota bacterium]|nr:NifU family protein [Campylobacterota bacterium]